MSFKRSVQALTVALALSLGSTALQAQATAAPEIKTEKRADAGKPRNVIFILSDDHRYDAMGFLKKYDFLKTPHMDALAAEGAYLKNAFVTTSLCSPSRASILTGQYMHNHRVADNNDDPNRPPLVLFPQYLKKADYQTAFMGKWHMGGNDNPQPGFDRWISMRGQGEYYPRPGKTMLNIDGKSTPQKGYITDELTDYALEWLNGVDLNKPFFLYLSHKGVHAGFDPAERHKTLYDDATIATPETQSVEANLDKPLWVQNQRNSWHGVDFPYHSSLDVKEYFRKYCKALASVDDSIGRVMAWLKEKKLDESTLVIYMGDNGFLFGEHGLIDKRNAYEESMRVPMLARCPELFQGNKVIDGVVANIDIGPTVLECAGLKTPDRMDGASFLGLLTGKTEKKDWRDYLLYEYYWEYNFPHTPTIFALRGEQYKFISYHGIWDTDELYDLQADPQEKHNLINDPKQQQLIRTLRDKLHQNLVDTNGDSVRFSQKKNLGAHLRHRNRSQAAEFPEDFLRNQNGRD